MFPDPGPTIDTAEPRSSRWVWWVSVAAGLALVGAGIVALAPFARLGAYNHPYADDPCLALLERQGLIRGQVEFYRQWTGRYASTFTMVTYPWLFGLVEGVRGVPWVMLGALLAAAASLGRWLAGARSMLWLAAAIPVVAIYASTMPKTASGLFWMTGAFTNVLGLTMVPVWLLAATFERNAPPSRRLARSALAGLLAVFVIGCSETTMVIFLVVLAATLPVLWRAHRGHAVAQAVCALAASAAVVLAPGNRVRMSRMTDRGSWLGTARETIGDAFVTMADWLMSPVVALALVAIVGLVLATEWRPRFAGGWIVAVTVAAVTAGFLPVHWSTGGPPGGRTQNTLYLAFLFGLLAAVAGIAARIVPKWRARRVTGAAILVLAVPLLATAGWNTSALRGARRDLATRAPAFHQLMETRYDRIAEAAAGPGTLSVPGIPKAQRPWTLYLGDITTRPRHWSNGCYARWFGLESIALEP